ncbi:hypothetical protein AAF712_008318 [Marasmius tenuissimus]|uniref:Glucose-methanol-choline oxidoreductase N-terminal domain-containing protein n=1 Tax=Marasmius tenuissimus TaxID=585030 RepID=A0ABR2ZUI3_9AGAR
MAWSRGTKTEYDSWTQFAQGEDWSWNGLLPYFKKGNTIKANQSNPFPGLSESERKAGNDPNFVGYGGPIHSGLNSFYADPVFPWVKTLNNLGVKTNSNPENGDNNGILNSRSNVNFDTGRRSYADEYYCRSTRKPNFHVLTGAQVTKVLFVTHKYEKNLIASGVQFVVGDEYFVANASKEVILAAGTFQSPQLLELSGIGNAKLLKGLNITSLIDIPSVGENLQDHWAVVTQLELEPGHLTFDELRNNATFAQEQTAFYNRTGGGMLGATTTGLAFLPTKLYLDKKQSDLLLASYDRSVSALEPTLLQRVHFDLQRQWLRGNVPAIELIQFSTGFLGGEANKSYISLIVAGMHHLSRGSVHVNSTDPLAHPVINPNLLNNEFDSQLLLGALRLVYRAASTLPMKNLIKQMTSPDPLATDAALLE